MPTVNPKAPDIVVAGHLCLDINPGLGGVESPMESVLVPGTLNIIDTASVSTGGLVANTGLALVRMGLDIALIGKIGKDGFGSLVRHVFEEHGAARHLVTSSGETTSYSVNLAFPGRDRIILHCPGSNDNFLPSDIDMELVKSARLFHFGYPQLLSSFFSDGGRNLASLYRSVRNSGVITSLDTAYPDPGSAAGSVNWRQVLTAALPYVHIFVPSVEELAMMIRPQQYRDISHETGVENFADEVDFDFIDSLADEILETGVGILLIKCGTRGIYLKTRTVSLPGLPDAAAKRWSFRQLWHGAFNGPVLNATGAGDCAVAGFLTALLRDADPGTALRIASVAGWRNIRTQDTLSGIGTYNELLDDAERTDIPVIRPQLTEEWTAGDRPGEWIGPSDSPGNTIKGR